jgi:hypothetical protein
VPERELPLPGVKRNFSAVNRMNTDKNLPRT